MRYGVALISAPGKVDAGYRGQLQVALVNLDAREPVVLRRAVSSTQPPVQRVEHAVFHEVRREARRRSR